LRARATAHEDDASRFPRETLAGLLRNPESEKPRGLGQSPNSDHGAPPAALH
jgi:hypothetical protein